MNGVAEARAALEAAEREAAEAQSSVASAESAHQAEQTLASARALREARELAADHLSVVEAKRVTLDAALQADAQERQNEAARELQNVDTVIQDDRKQLRRFVQAFAEQYAQLIKLTTEVADLVETDGRRVRKGEALAKEAGVFYSETALDLDAVRVAFGMTLTQRFGTSETSGQQFPPGSKLAIAIARLQGVQTYAAASAGLDAAMTELSFEEGSTFLDWLRPLPLRPEPGSSVAALEQDARRLIARYIESACPEVVSDAG